MMKILGSLPQISFVYLFWLSTRESMDCVSLMPISQLLILVSALSPLNTRKSAVMEKSAIPHLPYSTSVPRLQVVSRKKSSQYWDLQSSKKASCLPGTISGSGSESLGHTADSAVVTLSDSDCGSESLDLGHGPSRDDYVIIVPSDSDPDDASRHCGVAGPPKRHRIILRRSNVNCMPPPVRNGIIPRQEEDCVLLDEEHPPPQPRHRMILHQSDEEHPPPQPRHRMILHQSDEERPPPQPRHRMILHQSDEERPPPQPRHRMILRQSDEERPPPQPRHRMIVRKLDKEHPPPQPRHRMIVRQLDKEHPPPQPRHRMIVRLSDRETTDTDEEIKDMAEEFTPPPEGHTVTLRLSAEDSKPPPKSYRTVLECSDSEATASGYESGCSSQHGIVDRCVSDCTTEKGPQNSLVPLEHPQNGQVSQEHPHSGLVPISSEASKDGSTDLENQSLDAEVLPMSQQSHHHVNQKHEAADIHSGARNTAAVKPSKSLTLKRKRKLRERDMNSTAVDAMEKVQVMKEPIELTNGATEPTVKSTAESVGKEKVTDLIVSISLSSEVRPSSQREAMQPASTGMVSGSFTTKTIDMPTTHHSSRPLAHVISTEHVLYCFEHDHTYSHQTKKDCNLIRPLIKSPLTVDLTPPPSAEPCENEPSFSKPPSPIVYSVQISPPPTPVEVSPPPTPPLFIKHSELPDTHTDSDQQQDCRTDSPILHTLLCNNSDLSLQYSSTSSLSDLDVCTGDDNGDAMSSTTLSRPQENANNFSEELQSLLTRTCKMKKKRAASNHHKGMKSPLKNGSIFSRRRKGPVPLPRSFAMRDSTTPQLQTKAAKICYPAVIPNGLFVNGKLKHPLNLWNSRLLPSSKKSKKMMLSLDSKMQHLEHFRTKKFKKSSPSGDNSSLPKAFEKKSLVPVVPIKHGMPPVDSIKACAYKEQLMNWQYELNKQRDGTDDIIYVENELDMIPPPTDFNYICSNVYAEGVPNPGSPELSNSLCGCECYYLGRKCGSKSQFCCAHMAGSKFAYTIAGKVKVPAGTPIYECNAKCSCPSDCSNRIVQLGRKIPLCIFRTKGRGWGVKTTEPIKRNTFVTEYVGEVITNEEAERRGKKCDAEGITYLFDLDFEDENSAFTIDAAKYGNISHFFNHSCDPNLIVYSVWIDTLDKRLPRLAFFTTKSISTGEELTFDYQMNRSPGASGPRMPCLCGSSNCSGFIY